MIRGTEHSDRPISSPRRGWRRRALLWVPLALLLAGAAMAYPSMRRWAGSERSVELAKIRLGTVTRGDLERDVAVEGQVVAASHPSVFSPATGIVTLRAQAGEVVERGQVLAEIDSPELLSRLAQERATVNSMGSGLGRQRLEAKMAKLQGEQGIDLLEVRLAAAERAVERMRRIHEQGLANDIEYEQAEDELTLSRLELAHANKEASLENERLTFELRDQELQLERQALVLAEVERRVEELTLKSPVAGMVAGFDVEDRDAVSPGQALVTVVDLSTFELAIRIPEAYADEVSLGLAAVVRHGEEKYPATVRRVAPEVEAGTVEGRLSFGNEIPDGLRQNQRLQARLLLDARRDVLKVPRGPFLESGGGQRAYVVRDGLATRRSIQVGTLSVAEVEISSGLAEGESIVLSDTTRFRGAETVFLRR